MIGLSKDGADTRKDVLATMQRSNLEGWITRFHTLEQEHGKTRSDVDTGLKRLNTVEAKANRTEKKQGAEVERLTGVVGRMEKAENAINGQGKQVHELEKGAEGYAATLKERPTWIGVGLLLIAALGLFFTVLRFAASDNAGLLEDESTGPATEGTQAAELPTGDAATEATEKIDAADTAAAASAEGVH